MSPPIVLSNDPERQEAARRTVEEVRPFMRASRANRLAREEAERRRSRSFFLVVVIVIMVAIIAWFIFGQPIAKAPGYSGAFSFGTIRAHAAQIDRIIGLQILRQKDDA
jgi:hypothetical protein